MAHDPNLITIEYLGLDRHGNPLWRAVYGPHGAIYSEGRLSGILVAIRDVDAILSEPDTLKTEPLA